MSSLKGKTIFITGSSRGIGREIGLVCAEQGANIVVAAKSDTPHPKLPGTIHSVVEEVEAIGGRGLAIKLDVRDEEGVFAAMGHAADTFGGIDVLVNNASAIQLSNLQNTDVKRYDLIHSINIRGSLVCSKAAIPYLKKADNPHIITLSPPINLAGHWLGPYIPYTITKYGMTLLTLGLAGELAEDKISASTLWPKTTIATAAVEFAIDEKLIKRSRTPRIVADAALQIMMTTGMELSGSTLIDEDLLRERGVTDFDQYKVDATVNDLMFDLYLDS